MLLVVEDDLTFAMTMLEMARASGFKGVVATSGHQALELARSVKPDAITLDLRLPDLDGWVLLDRLKHDRGDASHPGAHRVGSRRGAARPASAARSASCRSRSTADDLKAGLAKVREFVEKRVKQLLVIEDDPIQSQAISDLIGDGDVETTTVASGEVALQALIAEGLRLRRARSPAAGHERLRPDRADQGRPARTGACR